jgi:hypothetical protein
MRQLGRGLHLAAVTFHGLLILHELGTFLVHHFTRSIEHPRGACAEQSRMTSKQLYNAASWLISRL